MCLCVEELLLCVHMCVHMYACLCVHILYLCVHVCDCMCICVCTMFVCIQIVLVCTCVCISMCACVYYTCICMFVLVCTYMCTRVCIYVFMWMRIVFVHTCVYMHVCLCAYTCVLVCACMWIVLVYECVYLWVCLIILVCTCICVCVCMCVYTQACTCMWRPEDFRCHPWEHQSPPLRQGLSLAWSSPIRLGQLVRKPQGLLPLSFSAGTASRSHRAQRLSSLTLWGRHFTACLSSLMLLSLECWARCWLNNSHATSYRQPLPSPRHRPLPADGTLRTPSGAVPEPWRGDSGARHWGKPSFLRHLDLKQWKGQASGLSASRQGRLFSCRGPQFPWQNIEPGENANKTPSAWLPDSAISREVPLHLRRTLH